MSGNQATKTTEIMATELIEGEIKKQILEDLEYELLYSEFEDLE